MPVNTLNLIIDAKSGVIYDDLTGRATTTPNQLTPWSTGYTYDVNVFLVEKDRSGVLQSITTPTATELKIGRVEPPILGTGYVTFTFGESVTIPLDELTAPRLQAELNGLDSLKATGGVDVVGGKNNYTLVFRTVGDKAALTVSPDIVPTASVTVDLLEAGTASVREKIGIRLKEDNVASTTSWSAISDATASVTVVQDDAALYHVEIVEVINNPSGGSFTYSHTTTANIPINVNSTASEFQALLSSKTVEKIGAYKWRITWSSVGTATTGTTDSSGIQSFAGINGTLALNLAQLYAVLGGEPQTLSIEAGEVDGEKYYSSQVLISPTVGDDGAGLTSSSGGGGSGDMNTATYDPNTVAGDTFDMDNMVEGTTTKILTATERTKLSGIETAADVTDTANVTSSGALMDSEVTNLAQVKAFDSTDYATAAQGTLADSATQPGDNISVFNNDSGYLKAADVNTLAEVNAIITDGTLIDTGDSRLSDSRTPTSHTHTLSEVTDSGTAAALDVGTTANKVVQLDGSARLPAVDGSQLTGLAGGGNMNTATYDPTAVAGDAFAMDNMVEGTTTKILTAAERTKLSGIETSATADQTGAEIKTAYEAEINTNAFTDTEQTKLTGIETSATADQTGAEIKASYEAEANTNAFTDTEQTKLSGIEALADITDTVNVTSSGALMDSEVTNLAQVKAFDSSDYATSAQGTDARKPTRDTLRLTVSNPDGIASGDGWTLQRLTYGYTIDSWTMVCLDANGDRVSASLTMNLFSDAFSTSTEPTTSITGGGTLPAVTTASGATNASPGLSSLTQGNSLRMEAAGAAGTVISVILEMEVTPS